MQLAASALPLEYHKVSLEPVGKARIAIARDKAFCFYYQDTLDLLTELGAELIPFSPLTDVHLPQCDGLILGGGYPELYAQQLADNKGLLQEVKTLSIAECLVLPNAAALCIF